MNLTRKLLAGVTGALLWVHQCDADERPKSRVQSLQKASKFIEHHDLQSAEALLQPLVTRPSPDGIALNLLGLIRMQQQRPLDAKSLFERAIDVNPRIIGPRLNLAALYGSAQPFEAIAQLKRVIEIAPNNPGGQTLLIRIAKESSFEAARSGDKLKSLEILTKTRDVIPGNAELLYEFGLAALDAGSLQEAQRALEKLLQMQPGSLNAHYALARVLLEESNAQQAEGEMRRYLAAKPDDATAHYGLGYILSAEQKTVEARAEFEKSLALEPKQTESLFSLGEIELEEGRQMEAREWFGKVLAIDPNHAGALTGVGIVEYRTGNYSDARSAFEHAISGAPSYQKAHYYYALTLLKLDLKVDSEREFEISKKLQKPHGGLPNPEGSRP